MDIKFVRAASFLCAAGLLLATMAAQAATITVTTTNDELNSDGDCSLREAVQAFNTRAQVDTCAAGTGNDTITFAQSLTGQTITLTKTGAGEDNNATGDLDVRFSSQSQLSLTIAGPVPGNQSSIVIDGNMVNGDCSTADRVLEVFVNTSAVSPNIRLDSLTITNGCINTASTTGSDGGGVYIHTSATSLPVDTLELVNIKVVNNKAVNQFEGFAVGGGLAVNARLDGSLLIKGSTFSNNLVLAPPAAAIGGGAALNLKAGNSGFTIRIANSTFNSNTASGQTIRGGGLALIGEGVVPPASNKRAVTISSIEASNNDVSGGGLGLFGAGAAIQLKQLSTNPQPFGMVIESSNFDNNDNAPGPGGMLQGPILGGGLYLFASGIGTGFDTASISGSTFSGNNLISNGAAQQDSRGGGAYLELDGGVSGPGDASLVMRGVEFKNNELVVGNGDVFGGGLALIGNPVNTYQMEQSTFSGNRIKSLANGEANGGGAVIVAQSGLGQIIMASNSFTNNTAESAALVARGGGLAIKTPGCPSTTPCVVLIDMTISSNQVSGSEASVGGGLALTTGPNPTQNGLLAHLGNLTIAQNTASGTTPIGVGLIAQGVVTVELANTIIAANSAPSGADCAGINGASITSAGYNLIGDGSACGLVAQTGDQIGSQTNPIDPLLGPLAVAATGTRFHLPLVGSPAIDAGNPAPLDTGRLDPSPACDGFDQRGQSRPVDGHGGDPDSTATCDIGAVERMANGPPIVINPIGTVTLTENGSPTTVDLDLIFNDPNGDPITFNAASNDTTVVTTNLIITGSTVLLEFTPQSVGTTTVDVTATDVFGASLTLSPTVNVMANQPPAVASAISDQQRTLGDPPFSIGLTTVFNDPEGGSLVFAASSTDTTVATVAISGNILTVSQQNLGSTMITITAEDNQNQTISDTFAFTVQNQAPVIASPIPDQTLNASKPQVTFDLSAVFNDPEGGSLSFTAFSSDTTVATTSLSGNILTIEAVAAGSATVTIAASDPQGEMTQDNALVTVQNQSPIIATPLPNQTLTTADAPVTIDLTTVFSDPEGGTLTFTASSSASNVATATVSGTTLTIDPVAPGSANVTLTATDAQGATVQDSAAVTVNNQSPIVSSPLPNQTLTTAGAPVTIDLTTVFSDPEGGTLTFTASSSASGVATATISGTTLTIDAVAPGNATVTVTATDAQGATVQGSAAVTVNNQAPVVSTPIPNQSLTTTGAPVTVNLAAFFSDPEGGSLTYAATSSNTSSVAVSVSGNTLTIAAVSPGAAQVTIIATDIAGASAQGTAQVTVNNQAPVVSTPLPNQTLTVSDPPASTDLSAVFSDPDGGALTFTASSSDNGIATATVSGSTLTIAAVAPGSASVTVTAVGQQGASIQATAQVTISNQAPVVDSPASDQRLDPAGGVVTLALNAVFSDPEGAGLSFAASSSDPGIATVQINAGVLTIAPAGPSGTATVTITATDGAASTTESLLIETNQSAEIVDQIGDAALAVGEFEQFDLGRVFADPDGDPLTFTAQSSNTAIIEAKTMGNSLVLTAVSPGSATITVTADDGFDAVNVSPTALRVAIVSPQGATVGSTGGGCVLTTSSTGGADPSLWLLLLLPAAWRVSRSRRRRYR